MRGASSKHQPSVNNLPSRLAPGRPIADAEASAGTSPITAPSPADAEGNSIHEQAPRGPQPRSLKQEPSWPSSAGQWVRCFVAGIPHVHQSRRSYHYLGGHYHRSVVIKRNCIF
ncbi:uncharacterized protein BDZ99DRAFT_467838 [Mytilinidion resinicola]|uniref:Uncharacterized protein n=1 Tax=Mytilinidion resinicola TaxID=574789 RepID=A0A6A6Y5B3_9PEZI|nr:uncharacterized protein BDZ99DRAFT_467838 [Mytilinidion resinicola]KAF2803713.1 hypothetical protein BDZ99DRAFT_467838 [Mytilinidion resinicola]